MIVITCSGTGGHIYPAIATAQRLEGKAVVFLIEERSISENILPRYGFNFYKIGVKKRSKWSFLKGFLEALRFFKQNKVSACISFGGYATVPVVLAAFVLRVPITICEQNTIPGKANRLLQIFSDKVCVSFESSLRYFNARKAVVSGNPLRQSYPKDLMAEKLTAKKTTGVINVVIMGGSQGAEAINRFFMQNETAFSEKTMSVIHILGEEKFKELYPGESLVLRSAKNATWAFVGYIENMELLYLWADKIIARAGATTIAELQYYQKEALLIPFPYASDNHQYFNAKEYEKSGLGITLNQTELSLEKVRDFLNQSKIVQNEKIEADFSLIL
jgi:UDP-N-acetylglucosamine--N-acetylmuramyl-(pentapeptide) pyrophosphoryl-undecaprenol N-acetylglucosamine transferase